MVLISITISAVPVVRTTGEENLDEDSTQWTRSYRRSTTRTGITSDSIRPRRPTR